MYSAVLWTGQAATTSEKISSPRMDTLAFSGICLKEAPLRRLRESGEIKGVPSYLFVLIGGYVELRKFSNSRKYAIHTGTTESQ